MSKLTGASALRRCCSSAAASGASAQQFTGGIRGIVSDANGVIPGVTVTVTNEATTCSAGDGHQCRRRIQLPGAAAGGLQREDVAAGLQDARTARHPHLDAAVRDARPRARARRDRRDDHGDRRRAAHRDVERVAGRRARSRDPRGAALARTQRVPHRRHRAHGHRRRRAAVQPPAGSDGRVADFARRRRRAGQQLHARRCAHHRSARVPRAESDDRSDLRHQGPGAHLRRRDGADRRRRLQYDGTLGRQRVPRLGVLPDPPGVGLGAGVLRRQARSDQGEQRPVRVVLSPVRRRRRWAGPQEPHVLLVCDRGLPGQGGSGLDAVVAEHEAAERRFLDDHAQWRTGPHLQPVLSRRCGRGALSGDGDRLARDWRRVHECDHPADASRRQSGGVPDGQLLAAAGHAQRRQPREREHHGQPAGLRRHADDQGRAQVQRPVVAERAVHLQPDQGASGITDARRALVPRERRQLADPTSQGVRSEQHERAERHDGHELPLRLHGVSRWPQLPGRVAGRWLLH